MPHAFMVWHILQTKEKIIMLDLLLKECGQFLCIYAFKQIANNRMVKASAKHKNHAKHKGA